MKIFLNMCHQFWAARQVRERLMLTWAMIIVLAALCWLVLIEPALHGRTRLQEQLPVLRLQSAQLSQLANEFASKPQRSGSTKAAFSQSLLTDSLNAKAIQAQGLEASGAQIRLHIAAISFALWIEWLESLQANTDVVVVEANIKPTDTPGQVEIQLTLGQKQ